MLRQISRLWRRPAAALPTPPPSLRPLAMEKAAQKQHLLAQIAALQQNLADLEASTTSRRTKREEKKAALGPLPPGLAAAAKRHIALKFSYDGWAHSGLAYQPAKSFTPLTTVEGCILKALETARLIEPMREVEGFGCGFERCGRTDAGVSSSAQVVNLWVRSDLEDPMGTGADVVDGPKRWADGQELVRTLSPSATDSDSPATGGEPTKKTHRKPISTTEIPYVTILNRHLPPTIRILAWSPVSETFSSRFSCIWRHYKYFFSTSPLQPFLRPRFDAGSGYPDVSHAKGEQDNLERMGWEELEMDVEKMREGVKYLVGDHDFRNMCKIDPPKQLPSHRRTIISATIDPVEGEGPDMYVLNLRGGAFLYNQVRHIVSILFHVGAGLEPPSVVAKLLWTSDRSPTTEEMHGSEAQDWELVDSKPSYGMADDLPLVLWECGYNPSEFSWRLDDGEPGKQVETYRRHFLDMNQAWTQARLKALIGRHHLSVLAEHAPAPPREPVRKLYWMPVGAGQFSKSTSYLPMLERRRGDRPEEINLRWAEGRGKPQMDRREATRATNDAVRATNLAKKAEACRLAQKLAAAAGESAEEQKIDAVKC